MPACVLQDRHQPIPNQGGIRKHTLNNKPVNPPKPVNTQHVNATAPDSRAITSTHLVYRQMCRHIALCHQATTNHQDTTNKRNHTTFTTTIRAQHISNQLRDVHGHLIDLRAVELLDISQDLDIVTLHEVDRHSLASEATAASNAVNVQLTVVGQVVVDHQRHLHTKTAKCSDGIDELIPSVCSCRTMPDAKASSSHTCFASTLCASRLMVAKLGHGSPSGTKLYSPSRASDQGPRCKSCCTMTTQGHTTDAPKLHTHNPPPTVTK